MINPDQGRIIEKLSSSDIIDRLSSGFGYYLRDLRHLDRGPEMPALLAYDGLSRDAEPANTVVMIISLKMAQRIMRLLEEQSK